MLNNSGLCCCRHLKSGCRLWRSCCPAGFHDNKKKLLYHRQFDSQPNQWTRYDLRENESVSVDPVGVLGVETHELVEKNVRDRGHTHGCTGVTRVGFGGRIDLWEHLMSVRIVIDYSLAEVSRWMWQLNKRSQLSEALGGVDSYMR